jgi:hypothetical protein
VLSPSNRSNPKESQLAEITQLLFRSDTEDERIYSNMTNR